MKKFLKVLAIPALFVVTLLSMWGCVIGAVLFRLLSMVVGFSGLCTVWAWLIGDGMAVIFAGITAVFCALMLIGTLIGQQSTAMMERLARYVKSH